MVGEGCSFKLSYSPGDSIILTAVYRPSRPHKGLSGPFIISAYIGARETLMKHFWPVSTLGPGPRRCLQKGLQKGLYKVFQALLHTLGPSKASRGLRRLFRALKGP